MAIRVVVVDGHTLTRYGLQPARDLRDRHPALGIVVLTSHGEDDVLCRAIENASAFVDKTAPTVEVLSAIRRAAVAAGRFSVSGLARALIRRSASTPSSGLSARELEVLRLLADGMSIPTVARTLFVSHSTAKTYVARLYEKLGAGNRAQALLAALRLGLLEQKPVRAA